MKEIYPAARHSDIVVQELDGELLIYDLLIHKAYCLNPTSAMIYRLCDGKNSVMELRRRLAGELKQPIGEDFLWLALDQLREDNLLANSQEIETRYEGLSRREVISRAGLTSMVALPVIAGLVAPSAAAAGSACVAGGGACNLNNPGACCSQTCLNNGGNPICAAGCTPDGGSCNLNNPGACCSQICSNNGGNPICGNACVPSGGSCNLNNPGACCSQICFANGGNPICG